jgi:hypothetical protein
VRFHIVNLLRLANIRGHAAIKRVLRLCKWNNNFINNGQVPRPVLVEFANPRHRDHFLTAAETIRAHTKGGIAVVPDDSSKKFINLRSNSSRSPGFNTAQLKSPRLVMTRLQLSTPHTASHSEGQYLGTRVVKNGSSRTHLQPGTTESAQAAITLLMRSSAVGTGICNGRQTSNQKNEAGDWM